MSSSPRLTWGLSSSPRPASSSSSSSPPAYNVCTRYQQIFLYCIYDRDRAPITYTAALALALALVLVLVLPRPAASSATPGGDVAVEAEVGLHGGEAGASEGNGQRHGTVSGSLDVEDAPGQPQVCGLQPTLLPYPHDTIHTQVRQQLVILGMFAATRQTQTQIQT